MSAAAAPELKTQSSPSASGATPLYALQILALAMSARILLLLVLIRRDPAKWFFVQATELGALAQSLINGLGLSSPFGGSTGPSAFLAPGYPAAVAVIFRIFGSYSNASAVAIMMLQALFGTATVLAILLLAKRVFGNREANIAGAMWAISPALLWLPTLFWESSLSILLLTAILALTLRCIEKPTWWRWIVLGSTSGLALLVNPSLALALTVVLIWAGWNRYKTSGTLSLGPALAALVCVLVFLPWPIRNVNVMHSVIPFRSNMGYELWQGNRPGSRGFFSPMLHPNINQYEFSRYATLGEVGYMREKSELAQEAIRANPARFLRLTLKRIASFWTGIGDRNSFFFILHVTLTTALSVAGLTLLLRRRHPVALLFLLPLLVFPLPYYVTHPDPRFRLVIDPITTILAAYVLVQLNDHLKQRRKQLA